MWISTEKTFWNEPGLFAPEMIAITLIYSTCTTEPPHILSLPRLPSIHHCYSQNFHSFTAVKPTLFVYLNQAQFSRDTTRERFLHPHRQLIKVSIQWQTTERAVSTTSILSHFGCIRKMCQQRSTIYSETCPTPLRSPGRATIVQQEDISGIAVQFLLYMFKATVVGEAIPVWNIQ